MHFVSQNVAMPIQVQGTPLREPQRDINQQHEEVQSQNGQPSQNEHMVTSTQRDAGPELHQEGAQWEEDAKLSTHHHKENNVTKAQGSEPAGSH